jgi:PAS domain S-box-containing protein
VNTLYGRFAELVCAISARLAGASGDRVAEEVRHAHEATRAHFDADQCGMMEFVDERGAFVLLHRVAVDGVLPAPTHIDYGLHFPAVLRAHHARQTYALDRLEDIAPEDASQLEASRAMRLGAYVGIPITIRGAARYSFALACERSHAWPREQLPLMQVLGETIANALERERDEARVRRGAADLAQAQRVAGTGSWVRDFIADHFSASEEAYRIIGARPVTAEEWKQRIHPADRGRIDAALAEILRERRTRYELEYRIVRAGGEERVIADQGEVTFDADGHALRAIGTIRDLTDHRQTQSELRSLRERIWHADRAARAAALGSSLSHELNQPLAAILANAQAGLRMLGAGTADPAEMREILEAVVRDDQRAVAIIDGLRSLLRRQSSPQSPVDVGEAMSEVIALMRGELDGLGVRVESRLASGATAMAVKAQLQQVALNLVSNALEALRDRSAEARRIRIEVEQREGQVEVSVADSGPGVDDEDRERIFDPFHSTRSGGLGLGLAISRSIAEAHAGSIRVEGNTWGGATFRFALPALPEEASAIGASAPTDRTARRARPRTHSPEAPLVCLVDDDAGVRDGFARLLSSSGYSVAVFASGDELLAAPETPLAACAVLDVRMGGLSGPELHARLAERHPALPILFLTGHGDLPTGMHAMRKGAVDFLLKPIEDTMLLAAVERAVSAGAADRAREEAPR